MASAISADTEVARGEVSMSRGLIGLVASLAGLGGGALISDWRGGNDAHASIGAVTSAAESRAQGVVLAESAKLRGEVQGELNRHRGDMSAALDRIAAAQSQQAKDMAEIRENVAYIKGQLLTKK